MRKIDECAMIITYLLLALRMAILIFFQVPPCNCPYLIFEFWEEAFYVSFPGIEQHR